MVGQALADQPATAAINGQVSFANFARIHGDFIAYDGLRAVTDLYVDDNVLSADDVTFAGKFDVGGDLSVGGDLRGAGFLTVDGSLRVAGDDLRIGQSWVGGLGAYEAPDGPPCACGDDEIFDVVAEVEAARTDNDNEASGLPSDIASIGLTRIGLSNGRYYFGDITTIGSTMLDIDGHVAVYIDGDLTSVGAEWIHLRDGATLDLYVSGAVRTVGHVSLGDRDDPSAFRLYIGGQDAPTISVGNEQFNGAIYAPRADLRYVGNTNVRGALFARSLIGVGNLTIGYAAPGNPTEDCDPPTIDEDPEEDPEDDDDPPIIL